MFERFLIVCAIRNDSFSEPLGCPPLCHFLRKQLRSRCGNCWTPNFARAVECHRAWQRTDRTGKRSARANSLALGFSGVRLEVVELLCQMLNRGVYPVIPEQGSVGASGDLAPLAHLALGMIGEGESFFENKPIASADGLSRANLKPIQL